MSNNTINVVNQKIDSMIDRIFLDAEKEDTEIKVSIVKINDDTYVKTPKENMYKFNAVGDFKNLVNGDILTLNREGIVVKQALKKRIENKAEKPTRGCKSRNTDFNSMF